MHADSFLRCVAFPFHSSVTTYKMVSTRTTSLSGAHKPGFVHCRVLLQVAWGLFGCMLIRFSAVWLLPFTLYCCRCLYLHIFNAGNTTRGAAGRYQLTRRLCPPALS